MPLHLIKLAVGCESVKELKGWVAERMRTAKKKGLPRHHIHITRMTPKRGDELLAGGSLYWVIRGEIAAREKLWFHVDGAIGALAILQRNLLIYGLGGVIIPFIGIKVIDVLITALKLVN